MNSKVLKFIKKECGKYGDDCKGCSFKDGNSCELEKLPYQWDIKKIKKQIKKAGKN